MCFKLFLMQSSLDGKGTKKNLASIYFFKKLYLPPHQDIFSTYLKSRPLNKKPGTRRKTCSWPIGMMFF